MASYLEKVNIKTDYEGIYDITGYVIDIIKRSGIESGMAYIHCTHTTAGLVMTSRMDPRCHRDFMNEIRKIVPARANYIHNFDTPTDAAGHIKTGLVGCSLTVIVENGKPLLGSSQGLLFAEFDGPRPRSFVVKVVSD